MKVGSKIKGGIYLVVDPAAGIEHVLPIVKQAIDGGADVLQIWNNWTTNQDKHAFLNAISKTAHAKDVPVLINEEWKLLKETPLDGVHFDNIPRNLNMIRQVIARPFKCGLTCGNDLSCIQWAVENQFDYISFCSMFPSPSAGVCEIVKKETVIQARQLTSMPIFLAGGITLDNLHELTSTGMNGVALISAIMNADDPQKATKALKQRLTTINITNHATITDR
jgi:thiamine-phosphate pyrophosphorylase